jgi:hypothetical protein
VLFYGPGTVWTASAHIITAVVGSGVLSLAWAIAQLGWIAGPAFMILFAIVTYNTSNLLSDCYRTGDAVPGRRMHSYTDAVRSNLGNFMFSTFLGILESWAFLKSTKAMFVMLLINFQVGSRQKFVRLFSTQIFVELPLVTP